MKVKNLSSIFAEGAAVSMSMEGELEETRSIQDDFVVLLQYFSWGIQFL